MPRPKDFPARTAAALFDFDETMIDLEAQHDAAHRALCVEMGNDYDALPASFRFGSGRRVVDDIAEMRRFFGWTMPQDELYARRHRHFLRALRSSALSLMPGVERVVRALHFRRLLLAVTTSADAGAVRELLERFLLLDCFEAIVGGSEVARGKPDPEAYLVTARKLGVVPDECIVFEDSRVGVLAAKNAGMYCVAVRNPNAREHQDLSAADLVLASFEELEPAWVTAGS
jgi:HAD superfamily hydrolase (TIGR01509 family)